MPGLPVTEEQRRELGQHIDAIIQSAGMTYDDVEDKSGYDEKTIRRIVKGLPTRARTLIDVCKAVEININLRREVVDLADDLHGGYTRKSLAKYVGNYMAYRWSYQDDFWIICSFYCIDWSDDLGCMRFSEYQRYEDARRRIVDFSQEGDLYAGNDTGLLYLLTIVGGDLRLITLTRLQPPGLTLRGCVLTQSRAGFYRPAVSPVFFQKIEDEATEELKKRVGEIQPGDPTHGDLATELREIEREVVHATFSLGAVSGTRGPPMPLRPPKHKVTPRQISLVTARGRSNLPTKN